MTKVEFFFGGDDSKSYVDWRATRDESMVKRIWSSKAEGEVTSDLDGSEWSQQQANG